MRVSRWLLNLVLSVVLVALAVVLVITLVRRRSAAAEPAASSEEESVLSPVERYGTLRYDNGTATLSFATDSEGAWYWADDESFPLDQSYVTRIVDTVSALKPQQTLDTTEGLEDYGLDKPSMTVTLTAGSVDSGGEDGQSGGRVETESTTLYIGSQVSGESGSYYLYIDGASETVFVVPDTLVKLLSVGIYDMMDLPELPKIPESDMKAITIRGPAPAQPEGEEEAAASGPVFTLTAYQSGGAVSWRTGGSVVTNQKNLDALLSLVNEPPLDRCVDFKPSDEAAALCGFDNPAAVLTARYTDSDGEEQSRMMSVGAVALDGECRYVRLDGGGAIYAVPSQALELLVTAAESGAEGLLI